MDYASGSLREPVALLVATHLAFCPLCRDEVARLESLGGALLADLDPEPVAPDALARALERLDEPGAPPAPGPAADRDPRLPRPLRDYTDGGLDRLTWTRRGNFSEARLLADFPGFTTRLLRIRGGLALPRHSHEGGELALVLAGGFTDAGGHYLRGDVALADAKVDHRPIADPGEDCLCLVVTDAPLRLTGRVGRYLNFLNRR